MPPQGTPVEQVISVQMSHVLSNPIALGCDARTADLGPRYSWREGLCRGRERCQGNDGADLATPLEE